ncbi:MAG: hypothetical protein HONBIEJF_01839 [Fimbriimonadaceae bacterium]|nr:hypothetical protein [Fimbriimonadaceae bacterium]
MTRGNLWYRFNRWVAEHLALGAFGGMRTTGRENVPPDGPLIVAPVHFSNLDPPVVACAVVREISFMAKEELFKVPILGPWIRSLRAFPLKRGGQDMEALRKAISLLEEGKALLVFPEGTRGDGVNLGKLNTGIAVMAKRTGAKVLPIGIAGTHGMLPRGSKWPKRGRIRVVIDRPIHYEEIAAGLPDKEGRAKFMAHLAERLIECTAAAGQTLRIAGSASNQETGSRPEPAAEAESPCPVDSPTQP